MNKGVFIHSTAEVSDKAIIGENTKIWNQAQVRENAVIGTNTVISKNVYVDANAIVGSNVKVQNNVNIYHGVTIEDDVFLGPSMTFTNDMYPRAFNSDWKVADTIVRKGASIGANATIRCGIEIGQYSMVGSGSVVTKDVEPYSLVVGNPAKKVGYVCYCGMKLNDLLKCVNCKREYEIKNNVIMEKK